MNSDPLDTLLARYAMQPAPPPPHRLTAGVWREIELRRDQTFWRGVWPSLDWLELFREPRVAFSALALALLIGSLPAVAARSGPQRSLAHQSLHLDVFSPDLPVATLWAGARGGGRSP